VTDTAFPRLVDALIGHGSTVKPQGERHVMAQCPAHPDGNPSLSVTDEPTRVLLYCHTGCNTEDVVQALGLTMPTCTTSPARRYQRAGATWSPGTRTATPTAVCCLREAQTRAEGLPRHPAGSPRTSPDQGALQPPCRPQGSRGRRHRVRRRGREGRQPAQRPRVRSDVQLRGRGQGRAADEVAARVLPPARRRHRRHRRRPGRPRLRPRSRRAAIPPAAQREGDRRAGEDRQRRQRPPRRRPRRRGPGARPTG
jgi:hypothetical protein